MNFKIHNIAHRLASSSPKIRTAGRIEFVRDQGPLQRNIRMDGFRWDPEVLKTLARILWSTQRSHSYAMAALRLFSRMPSSNFSPDGLLGGRGYIQAVKDMRGSLATSVETLSAITDTIYDEINANHWKLVSDRPQVDNIIQNVQNERANPEGVVNDSFQDAVQEPEEVVDPSVEVQELNPEVRTSSDARSRYESGSVLKRTDSILNRTASTLSAKLLRVSSSLPVSTLPGPRVDHIGPGEGGELGNFNPPSDASSDDPLGDGIVNNGEYLYEDPVQDSISPYADPTDGDSSMFKKAFSHLPGANNETMPDVYNLYFDYVDGLKRRKKSLMSPEGVDK